MVPLYQSPLATLFHGDCLEVMNNLDAESIDLIFADPPYNLSNDGTSVHAGKRVSVNKGDWDRSKGPVLDFDFNYEWIEACRRVLKPNGTIWISGTYHSIFSCGFALQIQGWRILNDIAWFKPNATPNIGCRMFTASHESLIWASKGKNAKHTFNYEEMKNGHFPTDSIKREGRQMRSVWAIGTPKQNEKEFGKHPAQKPVALLDRIIRSSTKQGDMVLDPFCGSGTTGVAAISLGRKFVGIDTNEKFLNDLALSRLENVKPSESISN